MVRPSSSLLLINEPPLQVLPSLAEAVGLNEAIVLQQIHYHAGRSEDGWVQRTVQDWRDWPFKFWSTRTIWTVIDRLRKQDLLIAETVENSMDRTLRYRINYDHSAFRKVFQMHFADSSGRNGQMSRARQDGELTPDVSRGTEKKRESAPTALSLPGTDGVVAVFEFWREVFGKNGAAKLTTKRRRLARDRLREGYDVERLKRAILGCRGSEWHVKTGNTDLTLICRSGEAVERFEAMPPPEAQRGDSKYDAAAALNERLIEGRG